MRARPCGKIREELEISRRNSYGAKEAFCLAIRPVTVGIFGSSPDLQNFYFDLKRVKYLNELTRKYTPFSLAKYEPAYSNGVCAACCQDLLLPPGRKRLGGNLKIPTVVKTQRCTCPSVLVQA
jgi:hypothetical protein